MRRVVMAACALALAGPALAQDQPAVSAVPSTSQGTAMQGAQILFWIALVLTRPLGATVGDFLSNAMDQGALA